MVVDSDREELHCFGRCVRSKPMAFQIAQYYSVSRISSFIGAIWGRTTAFAPSSLAWHGESCRSAGNLGRGGSPHRVRHFWYAASKTRDLAIAKSGP
ncbi:hypothetical protein BRPE64_ACDS24650 [Caballeronia insecticola]|uniref:Uncharacterized protein n=1 Tax=Caballeronia insecticola TaxID=758793 RepID=R4WIS4_9BURK|nr:hypothetical protein BRPE64_ACDS24650 [Caballeronia insecticola]